MARSGRYRSAKHREKRLGWAMIGLSVGAFAILVWAAVHLTPPERDPESGCPADRREPPPAHTLILVDQTDALDSEELGYARRLVLNEYFWLPPDGLLTVRSVRARSGLAIDAIIVCRMPLSNEVSELSNNRRAAQQDFERMAGNRMTSFLNGMARAPAEAQSPILEEILRVFRRADFGAEVRRRRLILFSDMIQNSDRFSQYHRMVARSGAMSRELVEEADIDLSGTAVRIQYIHRPGSRVQGEAHRQFWVGFFTQRGADVAIGHSLRLGEAPNRPVWYSGR